jgi:hypothetical protein
MAAAAALMATTSIAVAQTSEENYEFYITGSGDSRMVVSRSGEETPLLQGENGVRPSDCPAGSFYETADGVAACDDDMAFSLTEPSADMTRDDGQPFEEGAMILSPATNPGGSTPGGDGDAQDAPGNSGG